MANICNIMRRFIRRMKHRVTNIAKQNLEAHARFSQVVQPLRVGSVCVAQTATATVESLHGIVRTDLVGEQNHGCTTQAKSDSVSTGPATRRYARLLRRRERSRA